MNRRKFFGALFTVAAAPVAPNRVYSFLWDSPLVAIPTLTPELMAAIVKARILETAFSEALFPKMPMRPERQSVADIPGVAIIEWPGMAPAAVKVVR